MTPSVVLIDAPGWQGGAEGNRPFPNIGLAYLASSLERSGVRVSIIDMNNEGMSEEDMLLNIAGRAPDVIGMSVKTATVANAREIGMALKRECHGVPIVLGGAHATIMGPELIEEPWVDQIVSGEGEHSFNRLCRNWVAGRGCDPVQGVIRKPTVGGKRDDPSPALIEDLDTLPFPDYSQFPERVLREIQKSYPLITSRGCVYGCTYCSVPKISGRRVRRRTPEKILEELRYVGGLYGIEGFEIIDDSFNVDMERAKRICRLLISERWVLPWTCPNGLRADRVDSELASLMAEAGCKGVMVGVESADPCILQAISKGETIQRIETGIGIFKKAGVPVGGFFIIGLPGDSFEAEERAVKFAEEMGIVAHFNMLVPYPGTKLWEWAKENATFLKNIEAGRHFADSGEKVSPVMETAEFPARERVRAYEMVHTRLRRYDMVVSQSTTGMRRLLAVLVMIWKYDRARLGHHLRHAFRRLYLKLTANIGSRSP